MSCILCPVCVCLCVCFNIAHSFITSYGLASFFRLHSMRFWFQPFLLLFSCFFLSVSCCFWRKLQSPFSISSISNPLHSLLCYSFILFLAAVCAPLLFPLIYTRFQVISAGIQHFMFAFRFRPRWFSQLHSAEPLVRTFVIWLWFGFAFGFGFIYVWFPLPGVEGLVWFFLFWLLLLICGA